MTQLREYVVCNLCGSTDHRHYASGRNSLWPSEVFQVVQCAGCGLIFLNPRPVDMETSLRERPLDSSVIPKPQERRLYQAAFAEWAEMVTPLLRERRLLDFGCGAGNFWNAAQKAGWDAYGSDIGVALVTAARKYWDTERLLAASLAELQQGYAGYFDVVNASQVFEHLADPKGMAQGLKILLRTGAVLTVDVPNVECWQERLRRGVMLDVPAHFFYFSPRTIRCLLEAGGYRVLAVRSGFGARRVFARLLKEPHVAARVAGWLKKISVGGSTIQVVAQRAN